MYNMMPFMQTYGTGMTRDYSSMYPRTYGIVYPVVLQVVASMDVNIMMMPTQSEVDNMTEMVYDRVDGQLGDDDFDFDIPDMDQASTMEGETAQRGFFPFRRRRRFLRDLISILILRELFRRRGRFFF